MQIFEWPSRPCLWVKCHRTGFLCFEQGTGLYNGQLSMPLSVLSRNTKFFRLMTSVVNVCQEFSLVWNISWVLLPNFRPNPINNLKFNRVTCKWRTEHCKPRALQTPSFIATRCRLQWSSTTAVLLGWRALTWNYWTYQWPMICLSTRTVSTGPVAT